MAKTQTIDSGRFKRWLEAKKELFGDAIVGQPGAAADCPIATYLRETRGHTNVRVGGTTTSYTTARGRQRSFNTPKWGARFIGKIDGAGGRDVRASAALKALEG